MQLYKKEIPSFFHRRLIWEELFSGYLLLWRSSLPEVFCEKGVVRKFTKFTEKHLCQRLFFNKVAGLKRLWHRFFVSKNTFLYRTPLVAVSVFETSSVAVCPHSIISSFPIDIYLSKVNTMILKQLVLLFVFSMILCCFEQVQ